MRRRRTVTDVPPDLLVAGVDEAGRGPLAGPVVVAAVILDPARPIRGLDDSKYLSEERRGLLEPRIRERALSHAVARRSASVWTAMPTVARTRPAS